MFVCPICQGRAVGKVGTNQFYCWDCFLEFSSTNKGINVYNVDEDGSLIDYSPEETALQMSLE